MEIRTTSSPVLQREVFGIHVLLSLLSKDSSFTFLVRGSLEVFAVLPQGDEYCLPMKERLSSQQKPTV